MTPQQHPDGLARAEPQPLEVASAPTGLLCEHEPFWANPPIEATKGCDFSPRLCGVSHLSGAWRRISALRREKPEKRGGGCYSHCKLSLYET